MIPLITFVVVKGRGYYLAPAYPVLYAGGAVFGAELIARLRTVWRISLKSLAWVATVMTISFAAAYLVPVASGDSDWARRAFEVNEDFREEVGWPEFVQKLGFSREFGDRYFESCEVASRITNKYGVANEETTDYSEILLRPHLRESWPDFWKKFRRYG